MTTTDKLSLEGMAALVAMVGLVLFLLRNKRPHYAWLEWLTRKPLGPRQRVALVIAVLIGMFILLSIAVDIFTRRPAL